MHLINPCAEQTAQRGRGFSDTHLCRHCGVKATQVNMLGHTFACIPVCYRNHSLSVPQIGIWRHCRMIATTGLTGWAIPQGQEHIATHFFAFASSCRKHHCWPIVLVIRLLDKRQQAPLPQELDRKRGHIPPLFCDPLHLDTFVQFHSAPLTPDMPATNAPTKQQWPNRPPPPNVTCGGQCPACAGFTRWVPGFRGKAPPTPPGGSSPVVSCEGTHCSPWSSA